MRQSRNWFIRQQGFSASESNDSFYSALMLQPRLIAGLIAIGVLLQSPLLFLGLSAVLLWSALAPTRNPFDAIYNYTVAYRRGLRPLGAAPAPRRFAQGMASTFAIAIAASLFAGAMTTAW